MPNVSLIVNGKKFMWDGVVYKTKEEALNKMQKYKNDGFEVELLEEEEQYLLYTRRVVKEVVVDDKQ
ncbi:MAG: hypothetical protein ACE5WD_04670 [Candidatus Aminicenantia bacterium]